MVAAWNGYLEVVQLLLAYHPDPYLKNKDGDTTLSLAKQNRKSEVVQLLESYIAKQHVKS